MNEYEKQANDFLKETNTKIEIEFLKHDYYFQDDKCKRDIYKVTLSNDKHSYTFNFGQSIINSAFILDGSGWLCLCDRSCLEFVDSASQVSNLLKKFMQKRESKYSNKKIYEFKNPRRQEKTAITPTNYDILSCLDILYVVNFEDFCLEFGYDTDLRKAEKIYQDCLKEDHNLRRLFTHEELDKLSEIQ